MKKKIKKVTNSENEMWRLRKIYDHFLNPTYIVIKVISHTSQTPKPIKTEIKDNWGKNKKAFLKSRTRILKIKLRNKPLTLDNCKNRDLLQRIRLLLTNNRWLKSKEICGLSFLKASRRISALKYYWLWDTLFMSINSASVGNIEKISV